jgi:restriction system protein
MWAEIQRERARQVRDRHRRFREFQQAEARTARDAARAERARRRQAAVDERQRRELYTDNRRAEAAAMAESVRARLAELEGLLKAGLRDRPVVTFADLRRADSYPAFDAGRLGEPLPAPVWEHFAPEELAGRGKLFGGAARYEQQLESARADYAQAMERYTAAEDARRRQLAEQRSAHGASAAAVAAHNAAVDQFQRDCWAADPEAVAQFCTLVLDSSVYPDGFPHRTRAVYRPGQKEAVIEWALPAPSLIPLDRDYLYLATRDVIDALPRSEKETEELYGAVIAQVALRTIHEILISTPGGVIERVTFYGKVCATEPAAGQPVQPLLLQVSAEREAFNPYLLSDPDPVASLNRLNAVLSPHPYDLEPAKPAVDFDSLVSQLPCTAGVDATAGLDGRHDLLALRSHEFERLVRQVFEERGMQAWSTEAINDDGVDAVAVNTAVIGDVCVIQAKRGRDAVSVEAVRALAGVMEGKRAAKGILVTTARVTKDGHAFAARHGRIEIMECDHLKYLCQEHLGLDVLVADAGL